MKVQRLVTEYIKPEKAAQIAGEYRRAANEIRRLAVHLRQTGGRLEDGWIGKSKERFFSQFGNTPGEIENFANQLDHMASEIDAIEVKVEEWRWVEVDDPDC